MPKKTILLILVLAVVTVILVILAVTSQSSKLPTTTQNVAPTEKPVAKTAKVFFSPQNIDLSTGATPASVDVMIDSGGQDITGVQAELQYDPKALTNVRLVPAADKSGYFGAGSTVLFNDVKPDTGRISYAVAISSGQATVKGTGKIATLTFQKAVGAPASTQVLFLDKTLVTVLGANQSALESVVPLTVTLSSATSNQAPSSSIVPSVAVTH